MDHREDNRNQRRDKKVDRKKFGMRTNRGAKQLAVAIANRIRKNTFYLGDPRNYLRTLWGIKGYPPPPDWEHRKYRTPKD